MTLSFPAPASASFFSSLIASAADVGPVSSSTPVGNSQTMAILVAPERVVATRPERAIAIVEGTALLAEAPANGDLVEASKPRNESISIYEVRAGDTLAQIADMFGVTSNTVRWANDLKGPLVAGQRLVILPITGISHTVKSGDTLASIAKKYKADEGEITHYNDLEGAVLIAGQTVMVPDGEIAAPVVPKKPTRVGASTGSSLAGSATAGGLTLLRPTNGTKTQGIHGHNGIDIGAPIGTTIRAAAAGTVIIAKSDGWNGGYGSYIVVDHGGGMQTLYSHCSRVDVASGDTVAAGDTIGAVGNTGKSTGPHLHFEVRGAANPF